MAEGTHLVELAMMVGDPGKYLDTKINDMVRLSLIGVSEGKIKKIEKKLRAEVTMFVAQRLNGRKLDIAKENYLKIAFQKDIYKTYKVEINYSQLTFCMAGISYVKEKRPELLSAICSDLEDRVMKAYSIGTKV